MNNKSIEQGQRDCGMGQNNSNKGKTERGRLVEGKSMEGGCDGQTFQESSPRKSY